LVNAKTHGENNLMLRPLFPGERREAQPADLEHPEGAHAQPAGSVAPQSADPTNPLLVDFRYFDPEDDPDDADLKAVVGAIGFARAPNARRCCKPWRSSRKGSPAKQCRPISSCGHAWGHHACGTCAIGRAAGGVLGSDCRMHGTSGLRVVNASSPRVYMIAERPPI
jgi:choline dehydrogenase-like flavoprotein